MKSEQRGWRVLVLGSALAAASAFGCGGGGGGGTSGPGTGMVSGNLTRASGIQTASIGLRDGLTVFAGQWLGVATAIAQSVTTCGNPAEPAAGVTVDLLQGGAVLQTTTTDASGNFTFASVAPGNYVINVTLASGTISAPAIVQSGQATNLTGELDIDCHDVDHDGNKSENAIHVEQDTPDGSTLTADETEDGGDFQGEVKHTNGAIVHESGHHGDRSDEVDTEDGSSGASGANNDSSGTKSSSGNSSGNQGGSSGESGGSGVND